MPAAPSPCSARPRVSIGKRVRQRTDEGGAGEHHEANHVDAAIAENVAERRERQQRNDDRQLIGVDDPDRIGGAGVDFLRDRRQARYSRSRCRAPTAPSRPRGSESPSISVEAGVRLPPCSLSRGSRHPASLSEVWLTYAAAPGCARPDNTATARAHTSRVAVVSHCGGGAEWVRDHAFDYLCRSTSRARLILVAR